MTSGVAKQRLGKTFPVRRLGPLARTWGHPLPGCFEEMLAKDRLSGMVRMVEYCEWFCRFILGGWLPSGPRTGSLHVDFSQDGQGCCNWVWSPLAFPEPGGPMLLRMFNESGECPRECGRASQLWEGKANCRPCLIEFLPMHLHFRIDCLGTRLAKP